MVCNDAINNLTATYSGTYSSGKTATAYNGSYWQGVNTDDLSSKLVYTGDVGCIKSNWDYDYGITLNEDDVKAIVEKITKERELAKITPDEGPVIPKWTGFLPI